MYADAWRSPEFIKHDPLSFSFCSRPEIDVPLFSRKTAEIKVQNRSAGKTAIHREGTVIFEDVLVDFLQTRINEKYDKRKKGNSQDS